MDICKICLEDIDDYNNVYSPCNCRGNLNYIHISCFNKAYVLQNKTVCEICKLNFPIWNINNTYMILPNRNDTSENLVPRRVDNFQSNLYIEFKIIMLKLLKCILSFIYWFLYSYFYVGMIILASKSLNYLFF
jgi:E3 ubiquitin-protein ligase DOA10